jgi:hypothetical protein
MLVRCSRKDYEGCVVLVPREPRRATLFERDIKGDMWSDRVKVLEHFVSTPREKV